VFTASPPLTTKSASRSPHFGTAQQPRPIGGRLRFLSTPLFQTLSDILSAVLGIGILAIVLVVAVIVALGLPSRKRPPPRD
jgi:hypothetical protein